VFAYIVRRLLYSIPVLLATSFLIFTFVSITGDPLGKIRSRPLISQAELAAISHEKKLDRPVVVRYGYWLRGAVHGDFGKTLFAARPITPDIKRVLGHTLQLLVTVEIISVIVAIGIGVLSAIRQYSVFDYSMTTLSFIGFSMPVFWLALILQVLFTNIFLKWHVRIFYTAQLSSVDPGHGLHFLLDRAQHLALPVLTLVVLTIAGYSRFLRASMLEVINSDYVRTARAKGLTEQRVTMRHALRNALIPVVTLSALNFGALIGGAIVTESIFQLDGMGNYFFGKLLDGDAYPIMAWLMVTAVMVIVFNLIADILYGYLDPRVRFD
jgi:peptide/nickel transport system permease protein